MKFLKNTIIISFCTFLCSMLANKKNSYDPNLKSSNANLSTSARSSSLSKRSISNSLAQTYINSKGGYITSESVDENYIYKKYELKDTMYVSEQRFMNLEIYHNADIADTKISVDKLTMESYSYAAGFGFFAEIEAPGVYASLATEFATTIEAQATLHHTLSYSLYANNRTNTTYDSTGWYYLYLELYKADCVIIKTKRYSNTFVSATYITNCYCEASDFKFLTKRPIINKPVDPTC
ncbi:MAG: hypothetical protein NC087_00405 [Anaeroplasma bactoclasticum]|nr:hypothetical protein [Anaeroplasma bactoclasticum]